MKIREVALDILMRTHLFEMAFERRVVIDRLRAFQPQINRHALKLIVWPDAQDVPHWKRELTIWGNDLAYLTLRSGRGLHPIGFKLAWQHLYLEPFQGAETKVIEFLLRALQQEYKRPVDKNLTEIVAEYTRFIRPFCEAVGAQQTVGDIVNALCAIC